jgi:hypothetical protein
VYRRGSGKVNLIRRPFPGGSARAPKWRAENDFSEYIYSPWRIYKVNFRVEGIGSNQQYPPRGWCRGSQSQRLRQQRFMMSPAPRAESAKSIFSGPKRLSQYCTCGVERSVHVQCIYTSHLLCRRRFVALTITYAILCWEKKIPGQYNRIVYNIFFRSTCFVCVCVCKIKYI